MRIYPVRAGPRGVDGRCVTNTSAVQRRERPAYPLASYTAGRHSTRSGAQPQSVRWPHGGGPAKAEKAHSVGVDVVDNNRAAIDTAGLTLRVAVTRAALAFRDRLRLSVCVRNAVEPIGVD